MVLREGVGNIEDGEVIQSLQIVQGIGVDPGTLHSTLHMGEGVRCMKYYINS